jgi:hypothetical protein
MTIVRLSHYNISIKTLMQMVKKYLNFFQIFNLKNLNQKKLFLLGFFSLAVVAYLAYFQIFSFWFFHGWETSWLFDITGGNFSFVNLMKSHGFISYMNYLLFGWNPKGWFFTALIFHIFVACLVYYFLYLLTKSNSISFFSALLFTATTAHHDVITWGSFESLYAVQTGLFILSFILIYLYRKYKKISYIFILSIIIWIALAVRESGIMVLPLLFLFDFTFFSNKNIILSVRKHHIRELLSIVWPYIIIALFVLSYLLLRLSYGGSAHDFIDERVQFRILLFNEKRFLEYFWYGILAFGYYIGPYLIPYIWLNYLREIVLFVFPFTFINTYFFVFFGWVVYFLIVASVFLQRKSKYSQLLIFSLLSFTIITLFYSYAWTTKISFISTAYSWSENRWRYFAFIWYAPIFVITIQAMCSKLIKLFSNNVLNVQYCLSLIIFIIVSVQIILLYGIERSMFYQNHYSSIRFYDTLTKAAPNLNEQSRIYFAKGSPDLNNFLAELRMTKSRFYPAIKKIPSDWIRSQTYYFLKNIQEGIIKENDAYVFDFTVINGLQNRAKEMLAIYNNLKPINMLMNYNNIDNVFNMIIDQPIYVEFPFSLSVSYRISPTNNVHIPNPRISTIKQFFVLQNLTHDYIDKMNTIDISVCNTLGDQQNEPFYHLTSKHLIDGNLQSRSLWQADCRPAWVTYDLKNEQTLYGMIWYTHNYINGTPRSYKYQISTDGENWTTIQSVDGNIHQGRIDKFPNPEKTRYIRFYVDETNERAMLMLHELMVVTEDTKDIFDYYNNQNIINLFDDLHSMWDSTTTDITSQVFKNNATKYLWGKVQWQTEPNNAVPEDDRTYYYPFIEDDISHSASIEIPESEYYSNQARLLTRSVTTISLGFEKFWNAISIQSFRYVPTFSGINLHE